MGVKLLKGDGQYGSTDEIAVGYGTGFVTKEAGKPATNVLGIMSLTNDMETDITTVTFELNDDPAPAGDMNIGVKQLSVANLYNASTTVSGNGIDVTLNGQYDEIRFNIPADMVTRVEGVTINGADNTGDMSVKLLVQDGKWSGSDVEFAVAYGTNTVKKDNSAMSPVNYIGIMNLAKAATVFHIDSITLSLNEGVKAPKQLDLTLRPVKDALAENGILAGTCAPASTIKDEDRMALLEHHFNSVTCENEMKPDSFLSNATVSGNELVAVDTTGAVAVADALLAYNAEHPNDQIKMRGHVLVWHSQTPDKFFHEDFDTNKPFLSKEAMNVRLEKYIQLVMEFFYGEDSKYKDLVYAWDVVNEQANDDGTNPGIRMGTNWARVYGGSDEYIRNAFVYANKYAPANVKLFYNDYNDTTPAKAGYIRSLLKAIKATPGARIDAMGMQGHYNIDYPSYEEFEEAVRGYVDIVGEVHLTELDMKGTDDYDGKFHDVEYALQAYRYKGYYDSILAMNKEFREEGKAGVTGITFWGTDDGNSWLNDFNGAGGGGDGKHKVCPLLFDKQYAAKPAYWAFVDPSKMPAEPPTTKSGKTIQANGSKDANVEEFGNVTFKTIWNDEGLKIKVTVKDDTYDATDAIKVYYDLTSTKNDQTNVKTIEVKREDAVAIDGGYETTIVIDEELPSSLLFDMAVVDGTEKTSWSDTTNNQDNSNVYFGKLALAAKVLPIKKGSPADADDAAWDDTEAVDLAVASSGIEASAKAKVLWDADNLYVRMDVKDADLDAADSAQAHEQDSVEIFIDENNAKAGSYEADDKQYRVNYKNAQSFNGTKCVAANITSETTETTDGYVMYAAIKWTDIEAKADTIIGLDLQINDAKGGSRIGTANLFDASGNGWSNPSVFGTAKLIEGEIPEDLADVEPTTYKVKVTDGTGSALYVEKAKVTITAAKIDGKVFDKWVVDGDVVKLADATKETVTFDMPAKAVAIKATYKDASNGAPVDKAVEDVQKLIAAIGTVDATDACKAKIDAARKAYDALTDAQKKAVDEKSVKALADAEAAYAKAVEAAAAADAQKAAKFSAKSTSIQKGKTSANLANDIVLADGDKVVGWTTSNKKIVTVDKNGKIKAVKTGKATITATTKMGAKVSIKVTVKKKAVKTTKITVKNAKTNKKIKSASIKKGKTLKIKAVTNPITTPQKVTFSTSNKKVATVSSKGVIKAKKAGKATITVKSGTKKATVKVTVTK